MQPIDRNYFVKMAPETHQKWKNAIETFEKAANAAQVLVDNIEINQQNLKYDYETHSIIELDKDSCNLSLHKVCYLWQDDHLKMLVNSIGETDKDRIKWISILLGRKTNINELVPNSLDKFLKKVKENKVKTPEEKEKNSNEKQINRQIRIKERKVEDKSKEYKNHFDSMLQKISFHEKRDIYNLSLNLSNALEEASSLNVPNHLKPVKDAFCARLDALCTARLEFFTPGTPAVKTEDSALYKLINDPLCAPEHFIPFLAAIAPQTTNGGELRRFFSAYWLVIQNAKVWELEYIKSLKDFDAATQELHSMKKEQGQPLEPLAIPTPKITKELAEALAYAQDGKAPPAPYNPNPTPPPKKIVAFVSAPEPVPAEAPQTTILPPPSEIDLGNSKKDAMAEYLNQIKHCEKTWIYANDLDLAEAFKEADGLNVPANLQTVKNKFCSWLITLSSKSETSDIVDSALCQFHHDPDCSPEKFIPFLAAIATQTKEKANLRKFFKAYSLMIEAMIPAETKFLSSQKYLPGTVIETMISTKTVYIFQKKPVPTPKATKAFADALLQASGSNLSAVPNPVPTLSPTSPKVNTPPIPAPGPVVPQVDANAFPFPPPPPPHTEEISFPDFLTPPPPTTAPAAAPANPVAVVPPPSEETKQPENTAPVKEEGFWSHISSFFSWFAGLFVSCWKWMSSSESK